MWKFSRCLCLGNCIRAYSTINWRYWCAGKVKYEKHKDMTWCINYIRNMFVTITADYISKETA